MFNSDPAEVTDLQEAQDITEVSTGSVKVDFLSLLRVTTNGTY